MRTRATGQQFAAAGEIPLGLNRERAVAVFDGVWSSWAEGAQRHFDRAISGYHGT